MGNIIESLLLTLGIDTSQLTTGASKADAALDNMAATSATTEKSLASMQSKGAIPATKGLKEVQNQAADTSDTLNQLMTIAGKAIIILGGLKTAQAMLSSFLSDTDRLASLGNLGESITDIQAWGAAVERSGGSVEDFYGTLETFSQRVGAAARAGDESFKGVGISVLNANGEVRKSTEIMMELADILQAVSGQEAKAIAKQLGIDGNTLSLLQSGSGAVEELVDKQRQYSVYTEDHIKIAQEFKNALADIFRSVQMVTAIIMRGVVPALTWGAQKLNILTDWMVRHKPFITAFFVGFAAIIGAVLIPMLAKLAIANLAAFWPLLLILGAVAVVAGIIAGLVEDYITWAEGGESFFGDMWQNVADLIVILKELWITLQPYVSMLWEFGKAVAAVKFQELLTGVKIAFNVIVGVFKVIVDLVKVVVSLIKGDFKEAVSGLGDAFGDIFGTVGKVGNLLGGLKDKSKGIFQGMASTIGMTWDTIQNTAQAANTLPPSVTNNSARTITNEARIGAINIHSNATDTRGIAADIGDALSEQDFMAWEGGTY